MIYVCGIYGYHITTPIDLPHDLRIEPRPGNHKEASLWARSPDNYQLTAVLIGTSLSPDLIFNLEAILSFVEHLDVLITSPEKQTDDDPFAQFSKSITTHRRGTDGGGAVIMEDIYSPTSRRSFILKAIDLLQNQNLCDRTQFNILFHKYVLTFRQPNQYLDIKYFLLYSGLESYVKSWADSAIPESICEACGVIPKKLSERSTNEQLFMLINKEYKFDVNLDFISYSDNRKSVVTYTHLRNALFHNSKLTCTPRASDGIKVDLNLCDYLYNFSTLVQLVILKAVDFEDDYINWNSWIDRQRWKSKT